MFLFFLELIVKLCRWVQRKGIGMFRSIEFVRNCFKLFDRGEEGRCREVEVEEEVRGQEKEEEEEQEGGRKGRKDRMREERGGGRRGREELLWNIVL